MPEPIFEPGPVDTPFVYTVSGTGGIVPRVCQAVYDGSGAAGDYIPAVVFRSQAGHVISRAILQSTVTAGDDAEVSWFPHVGGGGSQPPTFFVGHGEAWTFNNQTIPNNAATAIEFTSTDANGDGDTLVVQLQAPPFTAFSIANRASSFGGQTRVTATLIVQWPAGAYDRYAEIVHTGTQDPWDQPPARARGSTSPDSDIQVVTRVLSATAGLVGPAVCNVFQSSGAGKLILAALFLVEQTNGSPG
jgi:hypothetical protein